MHTYTHINTYTVCVCVCVNASGAHKNGKGSFTQCILTGSLALGYMNPLLEPSRHGIFCVS